MLDIIVSVTDKEYPFFMKLIENFDFVTVKSLPAKQETIDEGAQEAPEKIASPALQGDAIDSQEFKDWVEHAEAMPSVTLQQAKTQWAKKRKELQQLIR